MRRWTFRLAWMALLFLIAFTVGTVSTDWFQRPSDPFWTEAAGSDLTDDERTNIDVYERASKAVVNITSTVLQQGWFFQVIPNRGTGSGFIVDPEGRILTNYHVIQGNSAQIEVNLLGSERDESYEARVLAVDELNDLALIQIDPDEELPWLPLGDSESLQVGRKVLAIGNPFGLEGTLTTGIISSLGRSIQSDNGVLPEMIQTDAAINPGNSGGPLLDNSGAVIGVNTAIYGPGGNIGIGFAMPISRAKPLLEFVRSGGESTKAKDPGFRTIYVSGRYAARLRLPPSGLLVVELDADGAAAQAGLRGPEREIVLGNYRVPWGGDFITEIDGRPVTNSRLLQQSLALKRGGDELTLKVFRDGEEVEVVVKLGSQSMRL